LKTISFYSYKGGVGRTLALAYTATRLARKNKNVCILDMDLEAPGVLYKFPIEFDMSKKGVVEYIDDCINGNIPDDVTQYFHAVPRLLYSHPEDYSYQKESGDIWIMNAGKGINTADYFNKMAKINWDDLLLGVDRKNVGGLNSISKGVGEGLFLFDKLKRQIKEQLNPDYLFIDSRSGVTAISKLCTSVLPDTVVLFFASNKENRAGSNLVYSHIKNSPYSINEEGISTLCVLTRIPKFKDFNECNKEFEAISEFVKLTGDMREIDVSVIHSDRDVEFDESFILFVDQDNRRDIIDDYWLLLKKIMGSEFVPERIEVSHEGLKEDANQQSTLANVSDYSISADCSDPYIETIAKYKFPTVFDYTKEAIEIVYVKTDKGLFLADKEQTFNELDKLFKLKEPDVIKNIVLIMKEFEVKKYGNDFRVELKDERSSDEKTDRVEDAKYRLYRFVSFMNKLTLLYSYNAPDPTWTDSVDYVKRSETVVERFRFPVKYHQTNSDYEFVLVKRDGEYMLTDQGRTNEMLDDVFDLREPDVTKNLSAITKKCNVQRVNNELIAKIGNTSDNSLLKHDDEVCGAMYRLLDCVSFMDTMRIFYV